MSAREQPRYVLRPEAFTTDASGEVRVWSPVAKKYVRTTPSLTWLLHQFRTPRAAASVVAQGLAEAQRDSKHRKSEEAVRSAIDWMRSYGILVEQLRPTLEELGAWLVSDVSPVELDHYGARLGQWHTVEVGSDALAEAIARRSVGNEAAAPPSAAAGPAASEEGLGPVASLRMDEPLLVCRRPDGRILMLGAAERARRAWVSKEPVFALALTPEDWLARAVEAPRDFFGTKRGGIPYQSIVHGGHVLVEGRRLDMIDRVSRLRLEDLAGKRVLDLGCNIGMNCQLAHEQGARETTGFDSSADLIHAALTLNCYFRTSSCFYVHDLERCFGKNVAADTALCFALVGHLRSVKGIKATLRAAGVSVLYVETHCEVQSQGAIEELLAPGTVRRTEFLGFTRDDIVRAKSTRRLYRCEMT